MIDENSKERTHTHTQKKEREVVAPLRYICIFFHSLDLDLEFVQSTKAIIKKTKQN